MFNETLKKINLLGNSYKKKKKHNPFLDIDLSKPISEYKSDYEPIFISGIGRSGTHFMATVFDQHNDFQSIHHDEILDSIADVYTWFAKWYEIPVSPEGFLRSRGHLIEKAGKQGKRYLEANAIICLNLEELMATYGGKLVIMVRNPKNVTESHFNKGWYSKVDYSNALPVPGYNFYHERSSHFFSRIMPKDPVEFEAWKNYTRMGKCAWKWRICYQEIFKQIEKNNLWDRTEFVYLNKFDYEAYGRLCKSLNIGEPISQKQYEEIVNHKPGKGKVKADTYVWTEQDKIDFNKEINMVIDKFTMIKERSSWILK